MKNRKAMVIIICVLIVVTMFIVGFIGNLKLVREAGREGEVDGDMIGILFTETRLELFDFESFFNDNVSKLSENKDISQSEMKKYEGRLYASFMPDELGNDIVHFDGTEGEYIIYPLVTDENGTFNCLMDDTNAFTDIRVHVGAEDEEINKIELEGTLYLPNFEEEGKTFYMNPVYQTSDGTIYAVSGSGVFVGPNSIPCSHSISESKYVEVNGERKTTERSVTIHFVGMNPVSVIDFLQFDGENELIAHNTYTTENLPEAITPLSNTDYILMESTNVSHDGETVVEKDVIQQKDSAAYVFTVRNDGICVEKGIAINWND